MTQWNDPQGRRPEGWEAQPTQYIPPDPAGQQPPQQYGGQQYDPPAGYDPRAQQRINPFGAESNEAFGIAGTVCALLGFVVLIVGLTTLDWFSTSGTSLTFSDVHHLTSERGDAAGFATAYFSWLAWTFAVVGVIGAVGSCYPSPAVRALRIVGTVIGIAAAGLSFLAIDLSTDGSYADYLKHTRAGFYLAVVGFLLLAAGAAIGPRKV